MLTPRRPGVGDVIDGDEQIPSADTQPHVVGTAAWRGDELAVVDARTVAEGEGDLLALERPQVDRHAARPVVATMSTSQWARWETLFGTVGRT